jgi:hypothetical protein
MMVADAAPRPAARCGARYPYISMAELADWLNAAAGGKSTWDAELIRIHLGRFPGSLTQLPPDPTAKSGRRLWYTTLDLLRDHCPTLSEALLRSIPDEDEGLHLAGEP